MQSIEPDGCLGMNRLITTYQNQKGVILPAILIIMLILTSVGLSIAALSINQLNLTTRNVQAANTLLAAEAGVEFSLYQLNQDVTFTGFDEEVTFVDNQTHGRTTYQTTVEPGTINDEKIITSTGRIYTSASDTDPQVTRSVRAIAVGTTTDDFSVQTGPGGLIMTNSATIANGDVHVNGFLDMQNSSRIGLPGNPENASLDVAHINCPNPPDENFPRQCEEGEGQPISVSVNAEINAAVCATNQTDDTNMNSPGLIEGCEASTVGLPDYPRGDHRDQVLDADTTMSGNQASCTQNNGTVVWPENLRVNGDVTTRLNCEVIVEGNIWVQGDITMNNSSAIRVADGLEESPTIMIDGPGGISMNQSSNILTNDLGIGAQLITFHSEADCSPGCSDVTGIDLFNSQQNTTIELGNSSLAAGSRFYARWSKVIVNNGGAVGSVLGQTVELRNSGNIAFGEQLSSGETVWAIKNYQQIFQHLE